MTQRTSSIQIIIGIAILALIISAEYRLTETQQAIITQFGEPVGEPVTSPGLHFKLPFIQAINVISNCKGKIILSGQGKSGRIAAKISSTLSSVGIPSFFIHPSETSHGDSGAIQKKDVLIVVSYC